MLDKMDLLERPGENNDSARFDFEIEYPSYKEVLNVEDLSVFVENKDGVRTLIKNADFKVLRGEKTALIGDNGAGKSTLLKTILGIYKNYTGEFEIGRNTEIGYYDQELNILNGDKTVFDEIYDRHPRFEESKIRTLLGSMNFYGEDVFKKINSLSGGEKAKLAFLVLMLEKNNTLFLDEPTNHLDLASKEKLDEALMKFEGTLFFVSHDRYFLDKVATKIIELGSEKISVYEGNYDYYLDKKTEADEASEKNIKKEKKTNDYFENKKKQSLIKSLEKKISACEEEILRLDGEIEETDRLLNESGSDLDKCRELFEKLNTLNERQNEFYKTFEELENQLETAKEE